MSLEGLQISHYHIMRRIGSGGIGTVYVAEDSRIKRPVAIKVFQIVAGNPEAEQRFQSEMKAITALDHPNIVSMYDFGTEQITQTTYSYLVTPYRVDGSLVEGLQKRGGRFSLQETANFVRQSADALQYIHEQGVIHQNIKPSNFLIVGQEGGNPTFQLTDFRVTRFMTNSSGQPIRTISLYAAPEQYGESGGRAEPATDQYALAAVVYQLLTGRPPFSGQASQFVQQILTSMPAAPSTINPQLPPALDAILLRALAKRPRERHLGIADFARAFLQAVQLAPQNTNEIRATLTISADEALNGTLRTLTLPGGRSIQVPIPARATDGQVVRMDGVADPQYPGGPGGALILTLAVNQPVIPLRNPAEEYGPTMRAASPSSAAYPPVSSVSSPNYPPIPSASSPNYSTPSQRQLGAVGDEFLPTVANSYQNIPQSYPGTMPQPNQREETVLASQAPAPNVPNTPSNPYLPAGPGLPPTAYGGPPPPPSQNVVSNPQMGAGPYVPPNMVPSQYSAPTAQYYQPVPQPPVGPPPRRRSVFVPIIAAVTAVLLIAGSVGGFFLYRNYDQQQRANATATATMAKGQATQTATAGIATATATTIAGHATATATTQAGFATATATVIAAHPYPPYIGGTGTPVLIDTLKDNTTGASWDEGTGCSFKDGSYNVVQNQLQHYKNCFANFQQFSSFTLEVSAKLLRGNCASVIFWIKNTSFYILDVCQDGFYELYHFTDLQGHGNSLSNGHTPAIHTGFGQTNLIAFAVKSGAFSIYLNHQKIVGTSTGETGTGYVALGVLSDTQVSEALFTNATIWV